jgi:hypothetical protein
MSKKQYEAEYLAVFILRCGKVMILLTILPIRLGLKPNGA